MKHLVPATFLVLCVAVLIPGPVRAQDDGPRSDARIASDLERSEQLYSRAFRSEVDRKNWTRAARLYVESASLRPYGDTKAYVALDRAGKLYSHSGRMRDAHRAFASAGTRALETGLVYEAALAFANAAEMSQHEPRDAAMAPGYLRTVHRLSENPSLTPAQRETIRQRAGPGGR